MNFCLIKRDFKNKIDKHFDKRQDFLTQKLIYNEELMEKIEDINTKDNISGYIEVEKLKNKINDFQKQNTFEKFDLNEFFCSKFGKTLETLEIFLDRNLKNNKTESELNGKNSLFSASTKENLRKDINSFEKIKKFDGFNTKEVNLAAKRYVSRVEISGTKLNESLKRNLSPTIYTKSKSIKTFKC